MITEFGVPSSIGSGHEGPLGRDQGDHSEQEAIRTDAELLRVIRRERLAGAFLFSWIDEWFKFTWNTLPRQQPVADRRQLWHDPWTNEQWFGLVATDAGTPNPEGRVVQESPTGVREIRLATDPSWLHLRVRLDHPAKRMLTLGFDVVPGGAPRLPGSTAADGKSDYAVVLDLDKGSGQAYVRPALDPLPLDYSPLPRGVVRATDGWDEMRLSTNRSLVVPTTGKRLPYETMDAGRLRRGTWDPASPDYDSRATWQADGQDVTIRIPWMQLGIVDPSSRRALVPRMAERQARRDDRSRPEGRPARDLLDRRHGPHHARVGRLERRPPDRAAQGRAPRRTSRRCGTSTPRPPRAEPPSSSRALRGRHPRARRPRRAREPASGARRGPAPQARGRRSAGGT